MTNSTKQNIHLKILFFSIFSLIFSFSTSAQQLAFPGAEGFGKYVTGGRGGIVLEVTNLEDSGPGSLREAIEQYYSESRTIIFRVSGTIKLESSLKIKQRNITIAGQTAPGDGITLRDHSVVVDADNVIIRFIRFRLGDEQLVQGDALEGKEYQNIIIDHCTMSWSTDECSSFYENRNFTMQWCILSESLYNSIHEKGPHGYGGIWGGFGASFHHNILAHHSSRNPRFQGSRDHGYPDLEIVDFANNVIYNWGFNSAYGGEGGNVNIRGNYYKYGPATKDNVKNRIVQPYDLTGNWYINDNYVNGYPDVTADNWNGGVQGSYAAAQYDKRATEPFENADYQMETAGDAYEAALQYSGASFPVRDTLDMRIVEEVRTGTATYGTSFNGGNNGIIDSQSEVGGWPVLNSLPAPTDTDQDGMPDTWEIANSLDPNDPSDRNIVATDGYTMLEKYINGLVKDIISDVDDNKINAIPDKFHVAGNYPNPFNPSTTIKFSIPASGIITVQIFNSNGELITELYKGEKSAGNHSLFWNGLTNSGNIVSSGFYLGVIKYSDQIKTFKMILLK